MKKFVALMTTIFVLATSVTALAGTEECKRYPTHKFKEVKQVEEVEEPEPIEYDYVNYAYLNSNGELKITSKYDTAEKYATGAIVETYFTYAKQGVKRTGGSGVYNEDGERIGTAYHMQVSGGNVVLDGKETVVTESNVNRFPELQALWKAIQ